MDVQPSSKEFHQLMDKIAKAAHESPTYEKLAYTIEKGYKHIIFMTASEVAEQAEVSQGSVSRFCIALGYKGYNDFLHHLQQFVRKEITAPQRLQYSSHSNKNISNILKLEHENIDALELLLDRPEYKKMIDQIIHADQLILLSARMSATLLSYTYYILNKIRANVTQITPGSPAWETLELMDPSHVHIFSFVFPRYPTLLLEKLKILRDKGFSISSITDSITSPVYALADPVLSIPITTSSIFDIYSTPILFLNLLLRDVATATEGLDKRMAALEALEKKNRIYYETHHYDETLK
ncbi:MurR/RpiR family transcriptional regulator [Sporolactobacillus sp. CPB3-1]|uniref:MurR/RpiR family transcriptional regulator n=1 Tax=Sporolactobacillus mangiferae TaxID=2940498 RepID=A0ABT0MBA1_9BACL|nr:MurR/RpiR family transcriptional regulator [Sporolactobacillus mangiferae]MCL1632146.1 MurR/RpiR family transcriptional regulator [Sporolactobacillus mangiferae]